MTQAETSRLVDELVGLANWCGNGPRPPEQWENRFGPMAQMLKGLRVAVETAENIGSPHHADLDTAVFRLHQLWDKVQHGIRAGMSPTAAQGNGLGEQIVAVTTKVQQIDFRDENQPVGFHP